MTDRSTTPRLRLLSILFAVGSVALAGCPTYVDVSPHDESVSPQADAANAESEIEAARGELAITQNGGTNQPVAIAETEIEVTDPGEIDSSPVDPAASDASDEDPEKMDAHSPGVTGESSPGSDSPGEAAPVSDVDFVNQETAIEASAHQERPRHEVARTTSDSRSTGTGNPLRDPAPPDKTELSGRERVGTTPDSETPSVVPDLAPDRVEGRRPNPDEPLPVRVSASAEDKLVVSKGKRTKDVVKADSFENRLNPREYADKNGSIFIGWKRPAIAFLFSGEQNGYIEPCGCSGLENQKGGLKRRHTLVQELESDGWPVVPLDLGGQVKRFGPQAEIKFVRAIDSLSKIGYQAIGFGPKDLRLDVLAAAIEFDAQTTPFVAANVALVRFDSGFTRRFRVIESGGKRIGVTSILGTQFVAQLQDDPVISVTDPTTALAEVVLQLQDANCDLLVLMSHSTPEESASLARRFPVFDFVVTAGGAEEPPAMAAKIEQIDTRLIEIGTKGMYVVVVGIYDDPKRRFLYQRVPLDARFKDSPEMQSGMVLYQEELEAIGLDGLELKPVSFGDGQKFAGTESCVGCHTEAADVFEITPHSHATTTLIDISDPPRQFDPECLSCHVTGWNPQKFFPYESGYESLEETPHLRANGCENCHGPGAAHVAAESPNALTNDAELERLRAALRLKLVENEGNKSGQDANGRVVQMCIQCHDLDNSPDFDFQEYWIEVEHQGME